MKAYTIILVTSLTMACEILDPVDSEPVKWEEQQAEFNEAYRDSILFFSTRAIGTPHIPSLHMMYKDGSGMNALLNNPETYSAAWSPRKWKILFVRGGDYGQGLGLYVMNVDKTGRARISHGGETVSGTPDWSPDGRKIAYIEIETRVGERIKVLHADKSEPQILTDWHPQIGRVSWMADSRRVVFSGLKDGKAQILVVSIDSPETTALFEYPEGCYSPACSPDGNFVAFSSFARIEGSNLPKIFSYNLTTKEIRQLTFGRTLEFWASWSPDSKSIAFSSRPPDPYSPESAFRMDWDGNNVVRLTDSTALDYNLCWYK